MSYINRHTNRVTKAEADYGVVGLDVSFFSTDLNPIGKIAAWSAAHRWWVVMGFVMLLVFSGRGESNEPFFY